MHASRSGAWFRGHRNASWELKPSLLRFSNGLAREESLFVEFKNRGAALIGDTSKDWETLAQMQHFGAPTRLLDWTERFSVAMFFALSGRSERPCLWILNPFLLCAKATRVNAKIVFDFGDDDTYHYSKHFVRNSSWPFALPVPVISPWKFNRIGQQGGFFTVHGRHEQALEELAPRFVAKVEIPVELISFARARLVSDGFDEFAIFRDLDSLGRSLARKYKMVFDHN